MKSVTVHRPVKMLRALRSVYLLALDPVHELLYLSGLRPSGRYGLVCLEHIPIVPIVGVGKERRTKIGPWDFLNKRGINRTRYLSYLEDYQPFASGLLTVNAIGTQLRDSINSNRD